MCTSLNKRVEETFKCLFPIRISSSFAVCTYVCAALVCATLSIRRGEGGVDEKGGGVDGRNVDQFNFCGLLPSLNNSVKTL